jgi:hypothetical protein
VSGEETTEPLKNGATLPDHPASTTSLKITKFGAVYDDGDGTPLRQGGLRESEIQNLMHGNQMALQHLYLFVFRNGRIFHTRRLVTVDCECVENEA